MILVLVLPLTAMETVFQSSCDLAGGAEDCNTNVFPTAATSPAEPSRMLMPMAFRISVSWSPSFVETETRMAH